MESVFQNPGLSHIGKRILKSLDFKSLKSLRLVCKSANNQVEDLGFCRKVIFEPMNDRGQKLPLHLAIERGRIEEVKSLVKNTKDMEARDLNGLTPLQFAIQDGRAEMSKILIENGANIEAECEKHGTTLCLAIYSDDLAITTMLLEKGADPSRPHPRFNLSPLHYANTHVFPEIQTQLIKFGANMEAKTRNGQTPLHWAARTCTPENVKELVACGADIDCQDANGNTPLHMVMFRRWDDGIKVVPLFLLFGASVNIRNEAGYNLLEENLGLLNVDPYYKLIIFSQH